MPDYAIVEINKLQYRVTPGCQIEVPRLPEAAGKEIALEKILLLSENGQTKIGAPYLTGKKIVATVVSQTKGQKISVFKYKAKSRYQKATGFRAKLTVLTIKDWTGREPRQTKVKK